MAPYRGHIGASQQLVRRGRVARRHRDAETCSDHGLVAAEIEWRAQGLGHRLRQGIGTVGLQLAALHDGELVASEPGHHSLVADTQQQPVGDLPEQFIADGMAEHVVDGLEAIEIEAENRELIGGGGVQRFGQRALKQVSVRQIGEGVVFGHVSDLLFGPPALGDVLVRIDPAAAGQFAPRDGDDAAVGKLLLVGVRPVGEAAFEV